MVPAALFISDLHLHPSRPGVTALFQQFLAGPAADLGSRAGAVFILGDLFDAWAGDDDLGDALNAEVCTDLRRCTDAGTDIYFIPGNRDFLVGEAFARASGLRILNEPIVMDIAGTATLLLHGDLLCTDDAGYQQFRNTVRSADWQRDFLAQPLAERKAVIEGLRARSEAEKQVKSMAIMDANRDAVAQAFRDYRVTRMIHGHTHRQAEHPLQVDGLACTRWVLGDWHEHGLQPGNALLCDAQGCRFIELA
ncbi:MAG: UDP-2,3-diacylglucosamine diphosphatase [Rhodocyclaceae bacterium]|nr:MAG: UDP-2,3-diacylglucosamine diphosphatase [Rhodocyclaceae bacterium]